ncbi:signal peptidase I [Virgibacillus sp. NKC19-3]|uniref:signal peptidase I n=1 Tax=Virgibacillus saliphilus TaxID=2831674 RepID=UPI001C9A39AB|nr:signal peptidase I [Virgibacillus sp. NKC19-3]MBY7143653.1 signal peptidase I [Virgibacillus sp. NKC19-3]
MAKSKSEWIDWLKALLVAFALAFIIRMFFFAPIVVDGPSMLPTLQDKDQMIVNKFIYQIREPERFDIVVFHASTQRDFIKRVIGLPGEHVAYENNVLYINGEAVEEPFITKQTGIYQQHTNDFVLENLPGSYERIPEGYVLVLGDNRKNSTDSRMLGVVSMDEIVGKTNLIYWPVDRMQIVGE